MDQNESALFQHHFPRFTDADIADVLAQIGPIVSVSGRVGVPNVFVLALGSETSRVGPLILTRTVARELRSLLEKSTELPLE